MSRPRLGLSGGTLAAAIVALAIAGAVAGTATGARVAAEAAPLAETAPPAAAVGGPAADHALPPQRHRVLGRVIGTRGAFLRVRTPSGEVVRVHVLPRAVIRKAGKPASLDAIQRGDRVLAVGRVNQNGVLQAGGVGGGGGPAPRPRRPPGRCAPTPPRPPRTCRLTPKARRSPSRRRR